MTMIRPGVGQALGPFQKLEQQPATLTVLQAVGEQQRGSEALLGEQAHALEFALEMSRGVATHQQLGQHRPATPDGRAHITLAGQHPQQAQQLQLPRARCIRQLNTQGQRGRTPGVFELRQPHQRASL